MQNIRTFEHLDNSAYYFYMKTKISVDFQISISVPLNDLGFLCYSKNHVLTCPGIVSI